MTSEEQIELERHIAMQGDEAGFSADRVAEAKARLAAVA